MHKQTDSLKYQYFFMIRLLLIISSFAIADTTEETTEVVETPAPKENPIKIGGQCA